MRPSAGLTKPPSFGLKKRTEKRGGIRHGCGRREATVYAFGASVLSWRVDAAEQLFLSSVAVFDRSKPIRGGIPLCFPQFGPYGDLPQHGFARLSDWAVEVDGEDAEAESVRFVLTEKEAPWKGHGYRAEYTVGLGFDGLTTTLRVENTGEEAFEFTAAFHNYLKVAKAQWTLVYGVAGCEYFDRLDNDATGVESLPDEADAGGVSVDGPVDRVYSGAADPIRVLDVAGGGGTVIWRSESLPEVTLWNPYGAEGADPGWEGFVCVEPAVVGKRAALGKGEEWVGWQRLKNPTGRAKF